MISENGIAMEEVGVVVIVVGGGDGGWWWLVVVMVVDGGDGDCSDGVGWWTGGDVQLFMTHLDFWRSQHSPEPPGNQNFYQSLQILHFQRFLAPTWLIKRNLKRPDLW